MDQGTKNDFAEKDEPSVSQIEKPEEGMLETEIFEQRYSSSVFSNIETVRFTSPIGADGLSECLIEEITVDNPVSVKTDSTSEDFGFFESVLELTEPMIEVEELLESIEVHKEETEEMLEMISRSKEKLDFFIFRIESLVKSLQEISKDSVANRRTENIYFKKIYMRKLKESAMCVLDKVKKSIKGLESDYKTLKKLEKKTMKTLSKIAEFHPISDPCAAEYCDESVEELKETVDYLGEEIWLLQQKHLAKIEKVSCIAEDIEMFYDLYRRFSGTEDPTIFTF